MVSKEYSEAAVEVLDILQHCDDDIVSRIPQKIIEALQRNKSTIYKSNLDFSVPLDKMNLKSKTRALIAMIYLNYLCDENEKEEMKIILEKNELRYRVESYQQLMDDK